MSEYFFCVRILVAKMEPAGVSQRSHSEIALGRRASSISDPKIPPQLVSKGGVFFATPKQ